MSDHKGPTRATLMRKASMHQRDAANYHRLATRYGLRNSELRDMMNHAYANCAENAHRMAWHYLNKLIEKGPRQ